MYCDLSACHGQIERSAFCQMLIFQKFVSVQYKLVPLNLWIMRAVSAAPVQVEGQRHSWVVVVVTVVAITSSSLAALSLYHVLALQAEVEVLRSEVSRRREGCRDTPGESVRGQQPQQQQHEDDGNKDLVRHT